MRYHYFVIADEDTVLGFRAAGLPGRAVATAADAARAIEYARERDVGILILTEEVADMARQEVAAMRFSKEPPMVVEVPGAEGPLPGRRSLSTVIREAVGIRV